MTRASCSCVLPNPPQSAEGCVMKNTVRVTTIGCALLAGATAWGQSVRYQLVEIDSPLNCANAINTRRHVVGGSVTSTGDAHAFLWIDGVMSDLGTLGGRNSDAFAINNRGIIVGGAMTASGPLHAFMMAEGGPMIDLGSLG